MRRRMLEFIPGALVWVTLAAGLALSFIRPLWVIYFIIVFDLLWLFRVIYFVTYLVIAWRSLRITRKIDWKSRLSENPAAEKLYHMIFLPTVKEDSSIIRRTLDAVFAGSYAPERFIIVLAGEERAGSEFLARAAKLREEYGKKFGHFLITVHPAGGLSDEIPGKGSNLNWSGKEARKFIDKLGIPYEEIIVSSFDVDTVAHPQYFAYLAHVYLEQKDPTRCSYQPAALYSNTIWDAPAPVRVASFGTTFWLLTELARPERLFTFSSHSMSFKMLVDVGFWQKDIVTEDSRIFLQGFFQYHGDYKVIPLFLPVSMDTVYGETYWKALVALYRQQRRWAWGVEHFPYMAERFRADRLIPRPLKWKYLWKHIEGMYTWATAPILIFILGWLPLAIVDVKHTSSLLVQNAPFTLELLMRLSMIGVLLSGILSLTLLPHPTEEKRRFHWLGMILQWLLLPITFVVFGAFPAIDAQTRLMFGKYLGFNVTTKRKSD